MLLRFFRKPIKIETLSDEQRHLLVVCGYQGSLPLSLLDSSNSRNCKILADAKLLRFDKATSAYFVTDAGASRPELQQWKDRNKERLKDRL